VREFLFQLPYDFLEVRIRKRWRNGVISARDSSSNLIFRLQHPHSRRQRGNLFRKIRAAMKEVVASHRVFAKAAISSAVLGTDASSDFFSFSACVFHSTARKTRHIIGIMLSEREHQMRLPFRDRIQRSGAYAFPLDRYQPAKNEG